MLCIDLRSKNRYVRPRYINGMPLLGSYVKVSSSFVSAITRFTVDS